MKAKTIDGLGTMVGAIIGAANLSTIDFSAKNWWVKALASLGIAALGYLVGKPASDAGPR